MPRTFVPHPETGQPVEVVTSYVSAERDQLAQEVAQAEVQVEQHTNEVAQLEEQLSAAAERKAQAEAALEESKSGLASYDSIAPQQSDAAAEPEGGSGEAENSTEVAAPAEPVAEQPVF